MAKKEVAEKVKVQEEESLEEGQNDLDFADMLFDGLESVSN